MEEAQRANKIKKICVGWPGPCDDHGPMHGCQLDGRHYKSAHVCTCGAKARNTANPTPLERKIAS